MPNPPLRVEVVRNGVVESTHLIDVAVLDQSGEVVLAAGDPETAAAFRSSVKPLQAAVSRSFGWHPADSSHLAIACASHGGEPIHLGKVRRVLMAAGLNESHLRCPEQWPFRPADSASAMRPRRIQHNCSGKHAGFLAACVAGGLPLDSYLDPDHPLQQQVRSVVESAARVKAAATLMDGCGAPTLVLPLSAIARTFAATRDSVEAKAMLDHPLLISGTGQLDTALLSAGILTKGGAEGLSCAVGVVKNNGPLPTGAVASIAAKVRDGNPRARASSLVGILRELGLLEEDALPPEIVEPPVLGGGESVGSVRLVSADLSRS